MDGHERLDGFGLIGAVWNSGYQEAQQGTLPDGGMG